VGLLEILKMDDQDVTTLSLGTDLTSLGLDLNASDSLSTTFFSPWSHSKDSLDLLLPNCYNVQPPPSAVSKLQNFSDETLFYIFYSMPRDKLQDLAAQELYNRNWKYHKELKIWLTRDVSADLVASSPAYEKGIFIFFDVLGWEKVKKEFLLVYEQLEERHCPSRPVGEL
jgi:CCR4-NOT transcription complex subunit 2